MNQYKTDFYVVGIPRQGTAAEILARTAEIGQPVDLKHEPDNLVDPNAVAVYIDGVRIGYVPNRGVSCAVCNQAVRAQDSLCPRCGSGDMVDWGLAGRIVHGCFLVKRQWAAYVSGLTEAKDGFVRCTLIVGV